MKECPFCLRPVGNDVVECPHCHNQVDIFRTGYFARPDLSRKKTAVIWIAVIAVVALLAMGLYRGCAVGRRADTSSDHGRVPPASPSDVRSVRLRAPQGVPHPAGLASRRA